jgi:hypothetical protein
MIYHPLSPFLFINKAPFTLNPPPLPPPKFIFYFFQDRRQTRTVGRMGVDRGCANFLARVHYKAYMDSMYCV